MAFSINRLGVSVSAGNALAASQSAIAGAVERLSSGLRINKAADDASGLGISEQIRSQVKGLNQSVRNANDLISMAQTADGSLSQVTDMLRRMRELATQARNASLSLDQKRAVSREISQLRNGINEISERTTFNTNTLLKNSLLAKTADIASDRTQFGDQKEVVPGLIVQSLNVTEANEGDYSISFGTAAEILNQRSRITTAIDGTLDSESTQAMTIQGVGTSSASITLSGMFNPGDAIRFTVKGDNPDRTLVQTYVVTAENLTENNDGLSPPISGQSLKAYTNIAAGMAAQYNAANIVTSGDVDLDNKFSKPDATASGATVTFSGNYLTTPLSSITVGGYVINRGNHSREIIPTQEDLLAGNRITVQINNNSYQYVVASDSTTESVAEGLRRLFARDYPTRATRAGSIVTLESDTDLGLANISYEVRKAVDSDAVSSISSSVSGPGSSASSTRTITISDNDVIAGRKFVLDLGNPDYLRTYSVIAGTDDTKNTIAQKFAALMDDHYGAGATGIQVSVAGQVSIGSAAKLGMANLSLSIRETVPGQANTTVGPARGITSAVWGVGGRLDDGNYEMYFDGSTWTVRNPPVAGATFNGSVLTTSPGNSVNIRYIGAPMRGDTIFFSIANGDPTNSLGLTGSAAVGTPGIYNVADDSKSPNSVTVSGGVVGTAFTATYLSAGYWSVDDNRGYFDNGRASNRLYLTRWNGLFYEANSTVTFNGSGDYPPIAGDQIVYSGSGGTAKYYRTGVQAMTFAVAGGLAVGDYTLEYNASTSGNNYTVKNRFGDAVTTATYASGQLTFAGGDRVDLVLSGTPKVGDKVYFTITAGNVITNRLVEGSNIGGRETSVSSQTRDRSDRVITISPADIRAGRSVELSIRGKEYSVLVESSDTASSVAIKLAGLLNSDYPNTTSVNETTNFPAGTRVSVSGNQITLQELAKLGLEDIGVSVREIHDPGLITITANSATGIGGRSQSLMLGEIAAGGNKEFKFDQLGISFSLVNRREKAVDRALFSTYLSPISSIHIASSSRAPMAQLGASASAGEEFQAGGFGDVRITESNRNAGPVAESFQRLSSLIDQLDTLSAQYLVDETFAQVINSSDSVLTQISRFQTLLGATHQRLEHAISGLENASISLQAAQSRITDVDYASEMAQLTRMQIGQQAASAMLAQGNLLPEVILSMLEGVAS